MKVVLLGLFVSMALISINSHAGKPACYSSHGGFCSYKGKVKSIYINSGNAILLYFDTPLAAGDSDIAGYSTSNYSAAIVSVSENLEFAKLFYSTALTAQASGRDVSIQMRGTLSGYMKADRIWLDAP